MPGNGTAKIDSSTADDDDRFSSDGESAESTQLLQLIGRGAFGSVYKAMYKGRLAAVKVVEHDEDMLSSAMDINEYVPSRGTSSAYASGSTTCHLAMLEGAVSSALSHPHVVQTYDWQETEVYDSGSLGGRATRIVMEWCDAGSLSDALQDGRLQVASGSGPPSPASLEAAALTLLEVAWALEYLHHMHIVHRDLKPANVLLATSSADGRSFTAKVSDFGLSRMFQPAKGLSPGKESQAQPEGAGTVTHMAPESLEGSPGSLHGDVYAFGILMWEVYTGGRKPYGPLSKLQIMCGVVEGLRPDFPPNTPAWYSALASTCWAKSPRQRPSSSAVAAQLQQQVAALRQQARQALGADHKPRAPSRRAAAAAALRAASLQHHQ